MPHVAALSQHPAQEGQTCHQVLVTRPVPLAPGPFLSPCGWTQPCLGGWTGGRPWVLPDQPGVHWTKVRGSVWPWVALKPSGGEHRPGADGFPGAWAADGGGAGKVLGIGAPASIPHLLLSELQRRKLQPQGLPPSPRAPAPAPCRQAEGGCLSGGTEAWLASSLAFLPCRGWRQRRAWGQGGQG